MFKMYNKVRNLKINYSCNSQVFTAVYIVGIDLPSSRWAKSIKKRTVFSASSNHTADISRKESAV